MAAEWVLIASAVIELIKQVVDFVKKEIEAGRMEVEELHKKPLEYFVSKYNEAIKAQAEAESHLLDFSAK